LLQPDHPAKALARNPFILRRLLSTRLKTDRVLSEAELAWDWWTSGALPTVRLSIAYRRVPLSLRSGHRHTTRRAWRDRCGADVFRVVPTHI
jgi:hypothetical protein